MAVLLVLCVPVILVGLGSYSVVNGDEAVYHAIAARMVESGNWFALEFKGEPRIYDTLMNAPLQYWARAALISVFGDNTWTMRILSALFGVATVLVTYRLVLIVSDRRAAFLSGLIQLVMGDDVVLVSSAAETAKDVYRALVQSGLERREPHPRHEFLCTGDPGGFQAVAEIFLGPEIAEVQAAHLEPVGGGRWS